MIRRSWKTNCISLATAACAMVAAAGQFSLNTSERSVNNEASAAIDRAFDYIVSSQDGNGSWNDDVILTSVSALALLDETHGSAFPAISNAVAWLSDTNRIDLAKTASPEAAAWRTIALAYISNYTPSFDPPPSATTNATAESAMRNDWPIREALIAIGRATNAFHSVSDDAEARFIGESLNSAKTPGLDSAARAVAVKWAGSPSPFWTTNAVAAWWFARSVNRSLGGRLTYVDGDSNVVSVDWRNPLRSHWINSQRIDAKGRGRWDGSPLDTPFALLLLRELQ